jgi:hypothetical protein
MTMTSHAFDAWQDAMPNLDDDATQMTEEEWRHLQDVMAAETATEPHPHPEQVALDATADIPF